jgi:protocatechuate 3,4-dioxygenase beta subunit
VQTEGPYFVDEMLERSDITSDPETGEIKSGIPLRVLIHVLSERDGACAPVVGATVDLWQCDALGVYGDVLDTSSASDTRGQRWLRGHQLTTATGSVEFRTIYPGWYSGRTVHLHVKVRASATSGAVLTYTSQLYFDDVITDQVMLAEPYAIRGARQVNNAGDSIFSAGGAELMLALRAEETGYVGEIHLGLAGT